VEHALERRALAAARDVAMAHRVACEQAAIMYSGSNVLVHLRPAPVVARVMTGTAALHDDPQRWLAREVSVLEFLAPSGLAVAPSRLISPGPHEHDGLWMTFTEWIGDVEPSHPPADPAVIGGALRSLHDELRRFDGELGTLSDLRDDIERLRGLLQPTETLDAETISSLRRRLDAAADPVLEAGLPVQALHGDTGLTNLLSTPGGLVWNDFEDTFRGPVHWDLAGYLMSLRARGATPKFVRQALDRYGGVDEQELAPFIDLHLVYDEIWRLYDRQRRQTSSPAPPPD
jgi:hypothetical protein